MAVKQLNDLIEIDLARRLQSQYLISVLEIRPGLDQKGIDVPIAVDRNPQWIARCLLHSLEPGKRIVDIILLDPLRKLLGHGWQEHVNFLR